MKFKNRLKLRHPNIFETLKQCVNDIEKITYQNCTKKLNCIN